MRDLKRHEQAGDPDAERGERTAADQVLGGSDLPGGERREHEARDDQRDGSADVPEEEDRGEDEPDAGEIERDVPDLPEDLGVPELVDGAHRGARFDLRAVPLEESGMAPKEIWCNESQERYVMAVLPEALPLFRQMCERERCPFAVVGTATEAKALVLEDGPAGERVIDMPMDVLLGKPPKMHRDVKRVALTLPALCQQTS